MSLQGALKRILLILTVCIILPISVKAVKKPYRQNRKCDKKIALTFDDGPHKKYTGQILDVLSEYQIKATFFVIGCNCEKNPELIRREISEGHEIGNHTYSHPHLTGIKQSKLKSEIEETERIIAEICDYKPRLFRPPEGVYSSAVSGTVEELDYIPILWTVDTLDWKMPSSEKIVSEVLGSVKSGSIILCHDYVSGKSSTVDALKIIIPKLLEEGYEFVTVGELISLNSATAR